MNEFTNGWAGVVKHLSLMEIKWNRGMNQYSIKYERESRFGDKSISCVFP
jgi:hypothetical protein